MMDKIENALKEGGAVILPTETVYGLFAKALDEQAVNHVYALKKRPRDKALNLNVARFEDILTYSKNQPPYLKKLVDHFLPGPLTLILSASHRVPFWVNSGMKTVGFRMPSHPITLDLIRKYGPLIGPSANLSGTESGKEFAKIKAAFSSDLQGIKDDQALTGVDSTILDLSCWPARILRQGRITRQDILNAIPEIELEEC